MKVYDLIKRKGGINDSPQNPKPNFIPCPIPNNNLKIIVQILIKLI